MIPVDPIPHHPTIPGPRPLPPVIARIIGGLRMPPVGALPGPIPAAPATPWVARPRGYTVNPAPGYRISDVSGPIAVPCPICGVAHPLHG